jgi:hypothetical protein
MFMGAAKIHITSQVLYGQDPATSLEQLGKFVPELSGEERHRYWKIKSWNGGRNFSIKFYKKYKPSIDKARKSRGANEPNRFLLKCFKVLVEHCAKTKVFQLTRGDINSILWNKMKMRKGKSNSMRRKLKDHQLIVYSPCEKRFEISPQAAAEYLGKEYKKLCI